MKRDKEHFRGCLLGGAVGDALGAPVEFLSLKEIKSRFGPAGVTSLPKLSRGKNIKVSGVVKGVAKDD
ncbi:MAG: ADP-ribosylglycohydrolase family protein [Syntrophomonadaceae bacterium]|nr:ADP-ribosylglycohydrolase family protein [Syntrophomonadaceae bacterium]